MRSLDGRAGSIDYPPDESGTGPALYARVGPCPAELRQHGGIGAATRGSDPRGMPRGPSGEVIKIPVRLASGVSRSVDADIAAGPFHAHAEVRATMPAHLGGSVEDRATLTNVTDNASRILDAAMQLPDAERAELAAILTDSIGDGSSPEEIEASWIAEAKRRLAAYRRGESTPIDLEDAMRELESKPRRGRERRASAG